jgi:hypothetical protein
MSATTPATYEDAQLILRLYELRRDEKLRLARDWFTFRFFPQSIEDIKAVLHPTHPENASLRMVTSYWEMAASFVAHNVLHTEMFLESSTEMLNLWAKLSDFIPAIRKDYNNPRYLANIETVIQRASNSAERIAAARERIARLRNLVQPKKA